MNLTPLAPATIRHQQSNGQKAQGYNANAKFAQPSKSPQFSGLGDSWFKISSTFWASIGLAGISYPAYSHLNSTEAVQRAESLDGSLSNYQHQMAKSLDKVSKASPENLETAVKDHQEQGKKLSVKLVKELSQTLSGTDLDPNIQKALQETNLSTEEQSTVFELLKNGADNPTEAFNNFADTILTKHMDKADVEKAKASMKDVFSEAGNDKAFSKIALFGGIMGSLVAAGVVGVGAMSGMSGVLMVVGWLPIFGIACVKEILMSKNKKKPTPPKA